MFIVVSICLPSITVFPLFLLGLVFTGHPLFQCLICVERYLAVVHPVTFLKYKPLRYRVICCTVAWLITLGSCFLCLYMSQIHTQFLSVQFLLAISTQLFCLVTVLRAMKQSGPGERGRERKEENYMNRRAFLIILINTVTTTIICPVCYCRISYHSNKPTYLCNLDHWFDLLCLASFFQPVLYLHRAGKLSCLYKTCCCNILQTNECMGK